MPRAETLAPTRSLEPRARRALAWSAVTLAICALLALRALGAAFMERRLDSNLFVTDFGLELAWISLYYLMWAGLTPFIFATARWQPFERGRRCRALLFHLPASVIIATAAPALLTIL